MNRLLLLLALGALLPAGASAAAVRVNAPALTGTPVTNSATLPVEGAAALKLSEIMVVRTSATFTLPSQTPDFAAVRGDKLAVAADTDGTVLVADAAGWTKSPVRVTDGETVAIEAVGRTGGERLLFDVKLTRPGQDPVTVQVTSPAADAASKPVTEMAFAGEGSATDISVAQVSAAVLPAEPGRTQDPAQIGAYVTWVNDSARGGALPEGTSDEAKQNAFAMNAGGTPKLEITAFDPVAKTVAIRGSYEPAAAPGTAQEVPLKTINGTLYLTYADALNGTVHVEARDVSAAAGGTATVALPEGAVFLKATVSLVAPAAVLTK